MEGEIAYIPSISPAHMLNNVPRCIHCRAMRFEHEMSTFCCDGGSIKLAKVVVPAQLYDLFFSQSDIAQEFHKHIRGYNSIFAFTSFGVQLDNDLASSR
ncbi:hypothetical protein P3L10_005473 [Capsicum annuum]